MSKYVRKSDFVAQKWVNKNLEAGLCSGEVLPLQRHRISREKTVFPTNNIKNEAYTITPRERENRQKIPTFHSMDLLSSMMKLSTNPSAKLKQDPSILISTPSAASGAKLRKDAAGKVAISTDRGQMNWRPPPQVEPVSDDETAGEPEEVINLGKIDTDAALYVLKENVGEEVKEHYVLKMPSSLPEVKYSPKSSHVFNLLMVDVSGSMRKCWENVQKGWNSCVAPKLRGRTAIYTFGSSVIFRREGTKLERHDFDSGGTDLTGALQTIINNVYQCKEKYVNVFIVTDGDHNATDVKPSEVINLMKFPQSKVCNIFILGVGYDFPVQYSIDIRSRLHNGCSNVPSLFWSKEKEEIEGNMSDISKKMYEGNSHLVKLGPEGSIVPGIPTQSSFHVNEWVYLPHKLQKLRELSVSFANHTGLLILKPQPADFKTFDEINRQWNSVIIQRHRSKEIMPSGVLDLKQRLFDAQVKEVKESSDNKISTRLNKKHLKDNEMQFRQDLSKLKKVLTTEKFENELELAENILSTTVVRDKYKNRNLKLKGHTDSEFDSDRRKFIKVLEENKSGISQISVTPDDCCRVTMTSTVTDLQDEEFSELLNESDKFDFLKNFTITGIPVIAPTKDNVILNPWTYRVTKMLKSPYTIMSYNAMESFADMKDTLEDKVVKLKYDDENSSYNAVVPVFSPSIAKLMKPIVNTRLYAMCVTFATTKNPHVVDGDMHMASLAVTWVRCLYENPSQPRAEHVCLRMESIEATAALYMDRSRYANYCKILLEDTPQALMTESKIQVENKPLKCESLVKPVFFLYMMRKYTMPTVSLDMKKMMQLILMEYVGRCLSKYKAGDHQSTPFCDFFAESLDDQNKRKSFVTDYISEKQKELSGNEMVLLEQYYTLEKVTKAAKKVADSQVNTLKEHLLTKIPLRVDIYQVERLRNVASAGDISWSTLRTFALEIGLQGADVNELFSEESLFAYTAHALRYRSSRDRLSNPLENYAEYHTFVSKKVQEESSQEVINMFNDELVRFMERLWLKAYFDVHSETVKPMTRQQVISEAQQRGINVSEENFEQVYKRFRPTGLLSNACQTRACPYFLQPDKSYNQHASVERTRGGVFVHGLHKAVQSNKNCNIDRVLDAVASGSHSKTNEHIPESAVRKLSSEIQRLKVIYQEMN